MIYVVLGMHKSGTTLVSQILHHSGIDMGESIDTRFDYSTGNKYEREETKSLNEEILGCHGRRSRDIVLPRRVQITESQRERMRAIIKQCNQRFPDWGFKDPRTSLVYPIWAEELPEHKIIATYRSLIELWSRYRPKKLWRRHSEFQLAIKVVKRWCEHNSCIINHLQCTPMDYLALNYRSLMLEQAEFDRLKAFVGRNLDDQRKMDFYRHRNHKESMILKAAIWWVEKQTGYSPESIMQQLDALWNNRKQA